MVKKRNRRKQTTTLEQRLINYTNNLRQKAKAVPPGPQRLELARRIRNGEAALHIDAMLRAGVFEFTE